jgi:hypothetical protein
LHAVQVVLHECLHCRRLGGQRDSFLLGLVALGFHPTQLGFVLPQCSLHGRQLVDVLAADLNWGSR